MSRLNATWFNFSERGQTWDHFWQDDSGVSQVSISGAIAEGSDSASGNAALALSLSGAITEGSDVVAGTVGLALGLSGAIAEGSDVTAGTVALLMDISGVIQEGSDGVAGTMDVGVLQPVTNQPSNWQAHKYPRLHRRVTDEEIEAQRIALGILPRQAAVIEQIAEDAADDLEHEPQLERALEQRQIEYAANLAAYFEFYRSLLITEELKAHYRRRRKLRMVFSLLQ